MTRMNPPKKVHHVHCDNLSQKLFWVEDTRGITTKVFRIVPVERLVPSIRTIKSA